MGCSQPITGGPAGIMKRTMARRFLLAVLVCAAAARADLVTDVRAATAKGDLEGGERLVAAARKAQGATPEIALAVSWLGRGALDRKAYDRAETYAADTRRIAFDLLSKRALDAEPRLPLALGAAIEVQARTLAARGQRSEAVALLEEEFQRWKSSSMAARIRKNLNLLTLEGKPAPPLKGLVLPAGHPVLLFFWAHWCPDCKAEAPVLARILERYGRAGLVVAAPTRHYGYVAGGEPASPTDETRYIRQIWKQFYGSVPSVPVAIEAENFVTFGASTTPTLVLLDKERRVTLYHPGAMDYDALERCVAQVTGN